MSSTTEKKVCGTSKWDKYASGYPHDLSDEQREILAKFLERVSDEDKEAMRFSVEKDDDFGCRVLRARKFDVDAALQMVEKTKKWRSEFGTNDLTAQDPATVLNAPEEEIIHHWPQVRLPGLDCESRPVYIEKTGKIDVPGLMKITTSDRLLQWHVRCVESDTMKEFERATQARSDGRVVNCGTTILDLEGFSLGMFMGESKAYLNRVSEINQNYYPETMGKMFVINAPSLFTTVWSVVKGWLDPRTVNKIEILGGPNSYQSRLFDVIGKENVPEEYGGDYKTNGSLFASKMSSVKLAAQASHADATYVDASKGESYRVRWWANSGGVDFAVRFIPDVGPDKDEEAMLAARKSGGEEIQAAETVSDCDKRVVGVTHKPSKSGTYVAIWTNGNKSGMFSSNTRSITFRAVALNEAGETVRTGKGADDEAAAAAASGTTEPSS